MSLAVCSTPHSKGFLRKIFFELMHGASLWCQYISRRSGTDFRWNRKVKDCMVQKFTETGCKIHRHRSSATGSIAQTQILEKENCCRLKSPCWPRTKIFALILSEGLWQRSSAGWLTDMLSVLVRPGWTSFLDHLPLQLAPAICKAFALLHNLATQIGRYRVPRITPEAACVCTVRCWSMKRECPLYYDYSTNFWAYLMHYKFKHQHGSQQRIYWLECILWYHSDTRCVEDKWT